MIDITFLDKLDNYKKALNKHSAEKKQGEQKSNYSGQGMIFKDHKEYVPGDDIRKIDWKAYARTKEYYIKRFQEEKNITVHIIVDRSSSMDYGEPNKYEYAAKIGLGVAYMTNQNNDRFRYAVFSETLTDLTSARRNANLGELVQTLNDMRKTPESKVGECLTQYQSRIKNKSLVIIISDFLIDIEKIENALKNLKNTETLLIQTLSNQELNPKIKGDKILKDPESTSKIRTYLDDKTKKNYNKKMKKHTEEIKEKAAENKAQLIQINTSNDFFQTFNHVWNQINQ